MKKILPIIIVVALLGVGAFALLGKGEGESGSEISESSQAETDSAPTIQKFTALKAAVELGIPMKCSYSMGGVETEGYIKGEQWRGKMESQDGQTAEVIMKDNCMWSWGGGQPQGIKLCFTPEEGEGSVWDQDDTSGLEYNCVPAAITDDKFTPPANIEFLDMSQGFDPANFEIPE